MDKINYKILKKNIPNVKLYSINGGFWYNNDGKLVPWYDKDGNVIDKNIIPSLGYIVKNINQKDGLVFGGVYKWNGIQWEQIVLDNYEIPILLTENINNLGIMSEFDGDIEQIEEKVNFTYTGQNNTITVFNTCNVEKYLFLNNSEFKIEWGDGSWDNIDINSSLTHTYSTNGVYTLTLSNDSEWGNEVVKKTIIIPYIDVSTNADLINQYFNEYINYTGYTNGAPIISEATSRLDELKKYGSNDNYEDLEITPEYTGYTFTYVDSNENSVTINYRDYNDGRTIVFIPEDRFVFINNEIHGELYNGKITRMEHLIGFVEEPRIYSDIFVERGKLGVMERNFRLSEIQSINELEIYGNGFFNVKKQ